MSVFGKIKAAVGAPSQAIKVAANGGSTKDLMRAAGQGSLGGQFLSDITGKNTVAGKIAQGDFAGAAEAAKSHAGDRAKTLAEQMQNKENDQYGQNQAYAKTLSDQDNDYLSRMQGNVGKYQGQLDSLTNESQAAQRDSRNTYSNDIQPRLKDLMTQSQQNAASAMSLKDAQDPNNSVAKATRDLYSQQAQNEGRQGLADTATLQALGMQSLGGQLGNVPMSGGQLQALMGASQAQAGANYSKSLQRRQSLEDQGLAQGFARSDTAYNQGQNAMNQYGNSVLNYQGSNQSQQAQDARFRGEQGGYGGQGYGLQQQMNDATRGVANAGTQRDMAIYNQHMGGQQANIAGQIGQLNAQQAQQAQMVTGGLQALGTVGGAMVGGPAGGAAGGAVGQQIGQQNAPQAQAIPQAGNYGSYGYASSANPNPTMQQQNMGIQTYMNANPSAGYNTVGNGTAANGLGLTDDQQSLSRRMASNYA